MLGASREVLIPILLPACGSGTLLKKETGPIYLPTPSNASQHPAQGPHKREEPAFVGCLSKQ